MYTYIHTHMYAYTYRQLGNVVFWLAIFSILLFRSSVIINKT